jgi:hypothetical protein
MMSSIGVHKYEGASKVVGQMEGEPVLLPYDKKRIPVEIEDRSFAGGAGFKSRVLQTRLVPTRVGGNFSE